MTLAVAQVVALGDWDPVVYGEVIQVLGDRCWLRPWLLRTDRPWDLRGVADVIVPLPWVRPVEDEEWLVVWGDLGADPPLVPDPQAQSCLYQVIRQLCDRQGRSVSSI